MNGFDRIDQMTDPSDRERDAFDNLAKALGRDGNHRVVLR